MARSVEPWKNPTNAFAEFLALLGPPCLNAQKAVCVVLPKLLACAFDPPAESQHWCVLAAEAESEMPVW